MAKNQVIKWCADTCGPLCEDSVRRLHAPAARHRIRRYVLSPGVRRFSVSKASTVYVLAGRCRIAFGDGGLHFGAGDVVELQSGGATIEVSEQDVNDAILLRVWELPFEVSG